MIICDTSIWIEYFRGRVPYFEPVCSLLDRNEILGVECIFGELLQGVLGKQERKLILDVWENLPKFPETGLWLEAGEYSAIHSLPSRGVGLIDAAIAVATLKTKSSLWTLDKKLASLIPARQCFRP